MPTIDCYEYISNDDIHLRHIGFDNLFSIMYYPDNPELREQYLQVRLAKYLSISSKKINNSNIKKNFPSDQLLNFISTITELPSHTDVVANAVKRYPAIVGYLVNLMAQLSSRGFPGSLNRGKALLLDILGRDSQIQKIFWDAKLFPPGKSTISKATFERKWQTFKYVSHLWAAYLSLGANYRNILTDYQKFIGAAEWYKNYLITNSPRRDGVPLLTKDQLWVFPDNAFSLKVDINFQFDDQCIKFLKKWNLDYSINFSS